MDEIYKYTNDIIFEEDDEAEDDQSLAFENLQVSLPLEKDSSFERAPLEE